MKLTVENFSLKNVEELIKNWNKEENVKLAIFSAELVIHLYDGNSDAPKKAIQAAKRWLENPTKENADAATAADAAAAAVYAAADAAVYAADADAAVYAAAVAGGNEVKQKIIDYINSKL